MSQIESASPMDSVTVNYHSDIQHIFKSYIDFLGNDDDTQLEIVMDDQHQRYLLLEIGWYNGRRIYGTLLHIDIINDKLWIQQDDTEDGMHTPDSVNTASLDSGGLTQALSIEQHTVANPRDLLP